MLNKIARYIKRHNLLRAGERYIVALSGGADSVALTIILQQLDYEIEAAHCNFHLRSGESNRDEDFSRQLCRQRKIPFHVAHFDTKTYAELHKISIEMAARELRYNYFEQLRQDIHARGICVAHHSDDSVETILINLVRGTGIKGLTGIKPLNDTIIRPLLCCSHRELENFLEQNGQIFVTDSTNLQSDPVRNKIRLQLLPILEQINPSVRESIMKTADHLLEAQKIIDYYIDENIPSEKPTSLFPLQLSIEEIRRFPSPEYLLHEILFPFNFTPAQIEQIMVAFDAGPGKIWKSSSHELLLDRKRLILVPLETTFLRNLVIPKPGTYRYSENITLKLFPINYALSETPIPHETNVVMLDADNIEFPLILRRVQPADRFVPFGMKGSKLVSDFLTDIKKNIFEKRHQLVLTDNNDQIIWLVGLRPSNHFCISSSTQSAMVIMLNYD